MKGGEKTPTAKKIEDNEEYIQLQKELTILNEKREEKLELIKGGDHSEEAKKEAREIVEQEIAIMERMSVIEMIYHLDDWEKQITFDFKNRPKEATITLLVIIIIIIISLILIWIFTYFQFSRFFFNEINK